MILSGTITKILHASQISPKCRFDKYVVVKNEEERSFYGLQVRHHIDDEIQEGLQAGRYIKAHVRCDHQIYESSERNRMYLHNNLILTEIIDLQ